MVSTSSTSMGRGGGTFIEIGIEQTLEVGGRFVVEDDGNGREGGAGGQFFDGAAGHENGGEFRHVGAVAR